MPEHPDIIRLRAEYAERARRMDKTDRYSPFNTAHLFAVQQRQRAMLKLLRRGGFYPFAGRRILEVGCGSGGVLLEYLGFGVERINLHGAELLFERTQIASHRLGDLPLVCADGQSLPYAGRSFDLVMQFTVFSSILDDGVKRNLAQEMLRIVRPGGMLLWYDFWLNPGNPQTRGICPAEIRRLFPDCRYQFRRITLAPPIARRLASLSWGLCLFLENLSALNTHYLVAIQPRITSMGGVQ